MEDKRITDAVLLLEHAEHIERELEEWRELLAGLDETAKGRGPRLVAADAIRGGFNRND